MKVIAFNGSPRKEGNTSILIKKVFEPLQAASIETEFVQIGGQLIHGCTACGKCYENQNRQCVIDNDIVNECIGKMIDADGIILGSPTYFADITPEIKALIDRAGYVSMCNGNMFRRKVGAGVVAVRRGGQIHAFDSINHFFLILEMIIPGSSYWNHGIGQAPGDVEQDEEGMKTMADLGENMAWLLNKIGH